MKTYFVILSVTLLHYALASPIIAADDKTVVELPAREAIEFAAEVNANGNTSFSSHYILTPGIGAHKLHKAQKKNWNDARNTCIDEKGHLVVINSAAEEAAIKKLLIDNQIIAEVWIGIHEQFKKDDWVSVKDERIDAIGYIHWRKGQPDNIGNNEHCLVTNQQGVNDLNCNAQRLFVCEI